MEENESNISYIINKLQKSDSIPEIPLSDDEPYDERKNKIKKIVNTHCAKLGIFDEDICDNITKKCILNEDNFENFEKSDINKLNITKNNIENQDICSKAWGNSIRQQVDEIINSLNIRRLLLKKNIKNKKNLDNTYLKTTDWIDHVVPENLKPHIIDRYGDKAFENIKSDESDKLLSERLKFIKGNKLERSLIDAENLEKISKKIISDNLNIKLQYLDDYELKYLFSNDHIKLKKYELNRKKEELNKFNISLQLIKSKHNINFVDIIEWLVYWQSPNTTTLPIFDIIFIDDDSKIPEKFKDTDMKMIKSSKQFYIDLLCNNQTSTPTLTDFRKKLLQIIFYLTSEEYNQNKGISKRYLEINSIPDNPQNKSKKMIELNDFIVHDKTYKDIFTSIAKKTGTEYEDKHILITADKIDRLFHKINNCNATENIKSEIKYGILKLLEVQFEIKIKDYNDYKKYIINEVIIKKEYFKTIATIDQNDVELLKLSYDIFHLNQVRNQSKKLESELPFPFSVFPYIAPMQKVLFLISNETDMDRAYAFYQAIKEDDVKTSIGELNNIISYYLEYLDKQNIQIKNKDKIQKLIRDVNIFDKKLVKIARSLQILTAIDKDSKDKFTIGLDDKSKIDIKVGDTQSSPLTKEYLEEIKQKQGTVNDVMSQLKKIENELYNYSELMNFLKLMQKHYYRI